MILILLAFISDFTPAKAADDIEKVSDKRAIALDSAFSALIEKHGINTAGVAVIKNAKLDWQNQYGLQSPGVPASADTLFNVASITKTVTAETILRLVADGKLSLDEAISPYWVDPDLKGGSTHQQLTARILLTHTSGFLNWRYYAKNYKLKFVDPPGTTFGYSGEGFLYLAKYAENKLKIPFEELVKKNVFESIGMQNVSISIQAKNHARIARPLDKEGKFHGYYCSPQGYCTKEGSTAIAANMVISVADYAKFLISTMSGEALSPALKKDRNTMQGIQFDKSAIDCSETPSILCPTRLGYGLGWAITQLENDKLIGHKGSDYAMVTLAYYYQGSGDGLIIFFNAPTQSGYAAMVDALELLDPDSPEIHGYKMRRARNN